jgi:hypothetical protein
MNITLMLKWIWKLYHNAEGLWADLIRAKYLGNKDFFSREASRKGSQFWNSIQKIKWYFKMGAKHKVESGARNFFWLDWWTGSAPLRERFPHIFECCETPFITVEGARVGPGTPGEWRLRFRRQFGLHEAVEWENLCREVQALPVSTRDDVISWSLEPSGSFSTRSMYLRLSHGAEIVLFKDVWRTRVPPKVKIFLWQLIRGRLPTCEQVAKRHDPSNGRCAMCGEIEDCNHIFFGCHLAKFLWAGVRELLKCDWNPSGIGHFITLAQNLSGPLRSLVWYTFAAQCWALWIIRNKLTIEGKLIGNPADAIFKMSIFMQQGRALVRPRERALLDAALGEVRRLHARSRADA